MNLLIANPAREYYAAQNMLRPPEKPQITQRNNILAAAGGPTIEAANLLSQAEDGQGIEQQLLSGMIERGLPQHIAEAFVMNMRDESGLNPGINEAAPIVPGSRGGFGLYQLTGPRRREYEAFAGQRGVAPKNVDAQLDFLMQELSGSEALAAKSIYAAPTRGKAAAAIVNNFLRPSPEHRQRRAEKYLRQG